VVKEYGGFPTGRRVTRFFDADTGTEIERVTIDRATGAPIGTRAIRISVPDRLRCFRGRVRRADRPLRGCAAQSSISNSGGFPPDRFGGRARKSRR
jgi:hypothetical protein